MAGGLGTRLGSITKKLPKTMVPVNGRPFLEYEISLLKSSGVDEFVLCVGHLGEMVEAHFEDGRRLGVDIRYSYDGPRLLGAAGALKRAEHLLHETFFVTYGDAYLRAEYPALMRKLVESGRQGVMAVYENHDAYGKSDLVVRDGMVVKYDKRGHEEAMNWINFGVSALAKGALALVPPETECNEEEFYGRLIERGELLAFPVKERFYEIGTPASLREFELFISSTRRDHGLFERHA